MYGCAINKQVSNIGVFKYKFKYATSQKKRKRRGEQNNDREWLIQNQVRLINSRNLLCIEFKCVV